ncbi:MAG: Ig-like domain-containing protein [Bacteroidales bacterium]|nr:Ig-like domain-containing protein [Bacteroidales bacterium]
MARLILKKTLFLAVTAALFIFNGCKDKEETVTVSKVSIVPASLTLPVGESFTLTVTVTPENATDKTVKWSSSNNAVATVDTRGVVTAAASGTANITATSTDGSKTAVCAVTVELATVSVNSIALDATALSLFVGQTHDALTVSFTPENASIQTVTWSSNYPNIVFVDVETGAIAAIVAGEAIITATSVAGAKTASCTVTVAERSLTGIAVTTQPTQKNYLVNDRFDPAGMVVTGAYDYGDPEALTITDAHLTYDFSSPGTKTVTITVDGQTAQVTDITVTAPTLAQSIAAAMTAGTPTTITLYADESLAPTALNTADTDITLVSDGPERTVTLSSNGSLFTLTNGAQLTLGNGVTLKGLGIDNANTGSLITINAGTLTMNSGSKLTDNWKNGDNGSAVWVMDNGTTLTATQAYFIMNGGTITGNKATTQGAVFVKGLFTMNGGTISNNSVTNTGVENGRGGGVFNSANGRFVMTGGNITGNTAVIGSGVCLGDGSSFTMTGGAITGNTNSSLGQNDLYITAAGPEGKAKFAGAVTAVVTLHGASNGSGDKSKITQTGEITGGLTVNIYTSSAGSSDGRTIITSDASYMGTLNTDKITLGNFIFSPPPSPSAIGDSYTLNASTGNLAMNL